MLDPTEIRWRNPDSPRIAPAALPSLRAYLGGNFGLTFANGVQNVILGWLVAHRLGESGASLGAVMAALMLPNLVLALVGGFVSDRFDPRKILPGLHLACVVCVAGLGWAISTDALSYPVMLGYALSMGVLTAFIAPARDALMSRVAGGALPRVVPIAFTANYVGQLLGALCAGMAEQFGDETALQFQAGALLLAAGCFARVRPPLSHGGRLETQNPFHEIREAWRQTLRSPKLRTALAMMLVMGLTLGGTYVPLITLITRDVYGGGSSELSLGLAAMMLGTTSGSVLLAVAGGVRRQGAALLVGLAGASIAIGGFSLELPFAGALALSYAWGLSGAVGMIMTRTISQENAGETHRARILSLFHLALTGSAPLGSLAVGFAVDRLGAASAALLPAGVLLAAVVVAATTSGLPRVESINLTRTSSENGRRPAD